MNLYRDEQAKEKGMSLQKVCEAMERRCFQESQKKIKLSTSTLHDRLKGGRSHAEAHEKRRWLNDEETEVLINEVIYWADCGFPLDHRRLKEHTDAIACARHGDTFPDEGVGKCWTEHFVSDHSNRLGTYWTHSMDHSRARAVNPTNHGQYFDLLEKVIEGNGGDDVIPPEL